MLKPLRDQLVAAIRELSGRGASARRRSKKRHVSEALEPRQLLTAVVSLVGDSYTAPAGGFPLLPEFVDVNGTLFFTADTVAHGWELWKSDGTAGGTVRVSDISVGPASSNVRLLTNVNGTLFFSANDGIHGEELWKSDGTSSGTVMVKDLTPNSSFAGPHELTNANGKLLLTYANLGAGTFVTSDGTADDTKQISVPGQTWSPTQFVVRSGTAYFIAKDYQSSSSEQIWTTDGTLAGTKQVSSLPPGDGVKIENLIAADDRLYFVGVDPVQGRELWVSDETEIGAHIVKELTPGSEEGYLFSWASVGSELYFSQRSVGSSTKFWRTDGTPEGTQLILESHAESLTELNGALYFVARNQLWKTDGTTAGTQAISSPGEPVVLQSSGLIVESGGKLFFSGASGGDAFRVWTLDGTTDELRPLRQMVADDRGVAATSFLATAGGAVFFRGNDGIHGQELWVSDGTDLGTGMVSDIRPGNQNSVPKDLTRIDDDLYFTALGNRVNGNLGNLWRASVVNLGTEQVAQNQLVEELAPQSVNGKLIFTGHLNGQGTSLFVSDTNGVRRLTNSHLGFNTVPLTIAGGTVYSIFRGFNSGGAVELWTSDGTEEGTQLVRQFPRLVGTSSVAVFSNDFFFSVDDGIHGFQLWKSDGTASGTIRLSNFSFDSQFPVFQHFAVVGERLFFFVGGKIGVTDGTPEGTRLVEELTTTLGLQAPQEFVSVGDTLFMSIYSPATGFELFKTNGTVETTSVVKDIMLGAADSRPRNLTNVNGKLVFLADEPSGQGLWVSDGTANGTKRLHAFGALAEREAGLNWSVVDNKVLFTVLDKSSRHRTIWITDGTADGTAPIPTHFQQSLVIDPQTTFTKYGDGIAFAAATEAVGSELFRIDTTIPVAPPTGLSILFGESAGVVWSDVPGAIQYDTWLQNLSNPSAPIIRKRVNNTMLTLANDTGFSQEGFVSGDAYRLWVRSLPVLGGPSPWSRSLDFSLGAPRIHSLPASSTNRTPTFQWATAPGAVTFELSVDNKDTMTRVVFQQGLTTQSFVPSVPLDPARYSARVRGIRANGSMTEWSQVADFSILAGPISLTSGGGESLTGLPTLVWSAVPGATGYDLQITAPGSNTVLYRSNNVQGTTHSVRTALASGPYKVFVRAIKGTQPLSIWGSGTDLQVKLPPTGLVRTGSVIAGNTGVAWNAVPLAISYTVEVISVATGSKVQADQTVSTTAMTPVPSLPAGRYAVRLRSNFSTGSNSGWSAPFSLEVFRSASVAITSSNAATADATPIITWTATAGASSYEIYASGPRGTSRVYTRQGITTTSHRIEVALATGINQIWVRVNFPDGSRGIWGTAQQLLIGPATLITRTSTGFSWGAVNAATQYELWLDALVPGRSPQRVVYNQAYVLTSYTLPSTLPKGRYQLWIRAIRAEGGELYPGAWSTSEPIELT